jgi:DNA-binding LacI/PurR family transcriptional regulator
MHRERRTIGIKDVARAAGVSVTTVSHALNGKGRLPEATRERVRRIADELGYRPNSTARNLVGGKTGLLGLSVSQPGARPFALSDFAYFTQLMAAASTAAFGRGYALVLAPPKRGLGASAGVAIDGAIIVDAVPGDPVVGDLVSSGLPLVTTGRVLDGPATGASWVDNDHARGARSALDHLWRRGARDVALMTSPTVMSYTVDVEAAYREWCSERGVRPTVTFAREDLTESAGYDAATSLLQMSTPPDAIYTSYDRLAYGTLLAAEARGFRVPDDLLLVTTAVDSGGEHPTRPAITSLDLNPGEIGRRATELLADLVEGIEPPDHHVIVPTTLVVRASTTRRNDGARSRARPSAKRSA